MESKNVKVIDEHSIDRVANVICKIDVDGSDYAIYSIERDNENDNLFVSKLVKNNDGTSNMINIEDTSEKEKMSEIVRELVKYAINDEMDKTTGTVTLNNGKNIGISFVLFNKEQNINVVKTYVTTVKKSVSNVAEKFYHVDAIQKNENMQGNVFEPVNENVFMPEIEKKEPVESASEQSNLDIMNSFVEVPKVENVPVAPEPVAVPTPVVEAPSVTPILGTPEVKPVIEPTPAVQVTPSVVTPVVSEAVPVMPKVEEAAKVETRTTIIDGPTQLNTAPASSESVSPIVGPSTTVESTPAPVEPTPTPVVSASEPSKLVFDGSKETNLNEALGEVSKEATIPVSDVQSIREFGQDEPIQAPVMPEAQQKAPEGPVLVRSRGFANNKFFMVVAIAFFAAACIFLGYEVWQYIKLK